MSYKHGMTYTPAWYSWASMLNRCRNGGQHNAASYSEKGISFDPAWEDFSVFFSDMGLRPEGKTLDRIDNDKGYCKDNCRWATATEQVLNRGQSSYTWGSGVNTKVQMDMEVALLCLTPS